jgi:phosphatidate phosphatase APP1
MAGWREVLANMASHVDDYYGELKYRLRERMGGRNPIMIQPYRGYGTPHRLYLKGRVLEDKGINVASDDDSTWDNLVNMYKRFASTEIPYARVRARFQGVEYDVVADDHGYFDVWIEPQHPLPTDGLWHKVELELLHPLRKGGGPARATGMVLVPPPNAQYAVISDIDDTVLYTDAVNLLRMARIVVLGNARTRLPFKGVAAFYRALFQGANKNANNPLFYVSNSPWNLYDLLSDFFNLNDIPIGPVLFLRNWGFAREQRPTFRRQHKLDSARNMLALFPHLSFILIGDSGEEDPEIYTELVSTYPNRIQAVYIRNVSRKLGRPTELRALADKVLQAGSTLIMADDTWPLAQHAAHQGWISPESLAEIDAARRKDTTPPNPIEQLLGATDAAQAEPETVVIEPQPNQPAAMPKLSVPAGAIQEALLAGSTQTHKPPTVIVKSEEGSTPRPASASAADKPSQ